MRLSVVICTRDRGEAVVPSVRAALDQTAGSYDDLVCVDQSASSETADALAATATASDPRLRYERMSVTGLSRARNAGVAAAAGDVIAFTDDDCIPPRDWLARIAACFEHDSRLGVLFAPLVRAPDAGDGWVPEFLPRGSYDVVRSVRVVSDLGLGGNFALRREVFDVLGGFDVLLGAGALFPASEDTDFGYRALLKGIRVAVRPDPPVLHFGARSGAAASRAAAAYSAGFAGMATKHARCGDSVMARALVLEVARWSARGTARLCRLSRPVGYRAAGVLAGTALRSLRLPVERERRLYRPTGRVPGQ